MHPHRTKAFSSPGVKELATVGAGNVSGGMKEFSITMSCNARSNRHASFSFLPPQSALTYSPVYPPSSVPMDFPEMPAHNYCYC